jgi:hypothetical protein
MMVTSEKRILRIITSRKYNDSDSFFSQQPNHAVRFVVTRTQTYLARDHAAYYIIFCARECIQP